MHHDDEVFIQELMNEKKMEESDAGKARGFKMVLIWAAITTLGVSFWFFAARSTGFNLWGLFHH